MAARAGQANVVKFLVANGADVDAKAKVSEICAALLVVFAKTSVSD